MPYPLGHINNASVSDPEDSDSFPREWPPPDTYLPSYVRPPHESNLGCGQFEVNDEVGTSNPTFQKEKHKSLCAVTFAGCGVQKTCAAPLSGEKGKAPHRRQTRRRCRCIFKE